MISDKDHLKFVFTRSRRENDTRTVRPYCSSTARKVFTHSEDLCDTVEGNVVHTGFRSDDRYLFDNLRQQGTRDLSSHSTDFLWYNLFMNVILQMAPDENAKKEMLLACRRQCRKYPRMLKDIDQFDQKYNKNDCIHWYTRSTFVYRLINRALRSEDVDELYQYRFYITDLSKALASKSEMFRVNGETTLKLYHGGSITREDAQRFEENIGNRIAINSYWSASRRQDCARAFACGSSNADLLPVLYTIHINFNDHGNAIVCADISDLSEFENEEEVLFDVGSIFKLVSMTKLMSENDELYHIELSSMPEAKRDLDYHIEEIRAEMVYENPRMLIGILLKRIGKHKQSSRYFETMLNNCDEREVAYIHNRLGIARRNENQDQLALEHFNKALELYSKHSLSDRKLLAGICHNIGIIHQKRRDYDAAMKRYLEAIKIIKDDPRDMRRFKAELDGSMSKLYLAQKKHTETIFYLRKVKKLREECLPEDHYIHAFTHVDLAYYYSNQNNIHKALSHNLEALRIREKSLPKDHVNTASSLYYVGRMYHKLQLLEKALDCYEQSVTMYEKCLPLSQCHKIPTIFLNIAKICAIKKDINRICKFYQQLLEFQKQALPYNQRYLGNICREIENLITKLSLPPID